MLRLTYIKFTSDVMLKHGESNRIPDNVVRQLLQEFDGQLMLPMAGSHTKTFPTNKPHKPTHPMHS